MFKSAICMSLQKLTEVLIVKSKTFWSQDHQKLFYWSDTTRIYMSVKGLLEITIGFYKVTNVSTSLIVGVINDSEAANIANIGFKASS